MCLVLMTELLFGAKKLNGESKPVLCVLGYEPKFREILNDIDNDPTNTALQPIGTVTKNLNYFSSLSVHFRIEFDVS